MPQFSVSLDKVVEKAAPGSGLHSHGAEKYPIYTADVNRPGLLLTGYDEYFDPTRIRYSATPKWVILPRCRKAKRRSHIHAVRGKAACAYRNAQPFLCSTRCWSSLPSMKCPCCDPTENTSSLMSALISNLSVEVAPRITAARRICRDLRRGAFSSWARAASARAKQPWSS